MHKYFVITLKGAEDIASLEISELIKAKNIAKEDTIVKFESDNLEDLCAITYKAQSIKKACLLFSEFSVKKDLGSTFLSFQKSLKNTGFLEWAKPKIKVECIRYGIHDFRSIDIAAKATRLILSKKQNSSADYGNPDVILFIFITIKAILGLTFQE